MKNFFAADMNSENKSESTTVTPAGETKTVNKSAKKSVIKSKKVRNSKRS
jgi:hypothetical protein